MDGYRMIEKTPWFPSSSKPVRKGYYETHWLIGSQTRLRCWNGELWLVDGSPCDRQDYRWRGLAQPVDGYVDDYVPPASAAPVSVPHDVRRAAANGVTPAAAWRKHLGLRQIDVAIRLGISEPGYRYLEKKNQPNDRVREKLATALGIRLEQLDL